MPPIDDPKPSFSSGQRWMGATNTALAAVAAFALVVMFNYIASGHFLRWHVARDAAFKLSRQTQAVLESLTNDVQVTIFFQPDGDNEEIYGLTRSLLNEYQNANPRHIHLHLLNYTRFAGEAKELLSKHKLSDLKEKDFVLFECDGHPKVVYARELADYDFSGLLTGRSKMVRRSAFKGELLFTSDIYAVSHPQALKSYFLAGHGENDPGQPSGEQENLGSFGYSKLASILKEEIDSDWDRLTLAGTNDIPRDCQLLIVAGPKGDFLPEEVNKIAAYLKNGGRLLALLPQPCGLENMLKQQWGVRLGDSRVVDPTRSESPGSFLTDQLSPHRIMDPLIKDRRPILMVWTRPIYIAQDHGKIPGAPEITPLAATSKEGMDENKRIDTYYLLAAIEQGVIKGVDTPRDAGTRIVIAGDSVFLDDQVIASWGANHDFAQLALNWLLQRPQIMLAGLVPQPIKEYKLYLTSAQSSSVRWLFLGGMPASILALGGLVWLRRRH
jgi:hypothetical protein